MKHIHVSLFRTQDAAGKHIGGVEVFGAYLKRAVPELLLVSWPDYPQWRECGDLQDYEKAEVLSGWMLSLGIADKNTTVIVDGYWGRGLEGKVGRLISVCHGSYWGRFLRAQVHGWGEVVGIDHLEAQFEMFDDPHVEVVCVAEESRRELHSAGIALGTTTVIYHGVDLEVYKPLRPGKVWMHAATSTRKGLDICQMVHDMDNDIEIEFMNEPTGDPSRKANRLNDAIALIAPSRHEGNSYLLIEALACGVPIIGYKTGLAIEMDERCGVFTDDMAPHAFVRMIKRFSKEDHSPREWAEENCSLVKFISDWKEYLHV